MAKRKAAKRKAVRRKAVTRATSAAHDGSHAVRGQEKRGSAAKTRASRQKTASAAKKAAKGAARKKTASLDEDKGQQETAPAQEAASKKTAATKGRRPVAKEPLRPRKTAARTAVAWPDCRRTAPGLNRERRTIRDDDIVQTPPSSLDFDRSASAARSGRRELRERYAEHTETESGDDQAATSMPIGSRPTASATRRRAATTRRPIRTSSTTSAAPWASSIRTTRNSRARRRSRARSQSLGAGSGLFRRLG